jgi:DNA-binding LacI/PurR family transcriptional regulator
MFKALSDVARRHGLNLILYDKNNDPGIEKRCIRNLIDTMAMGIIVVPVSENINGIRRMTKNTVPVVYLGGNVRPDDVNYVCCDSTVRGQGYPGNRRDGALREAGIKIPEQVSVVGYDGIDASELPLVELTTVAQPRMEMAENVIDILLRHAQKASTPPEHYLAKPKLKIRHSTSAR